MAESKLKSKPAKKRKPGRPVTKIIQPIPATPEKLAQAVVSTPPMQARRQG